MIMVGWGVGQISLLITRGMAEVSRGAEFKHAILEQLLKFIGRKILLSCTHHLFVCTKTIKRFMDDLVYRLKPKPSKNDS